MKSKSGVDHCFRVISEDKVTVKKQYQVMTFTIFHNHSEITKVSLSPSCTNAELMTTLKHKLQQKNFPVDRILYLESMTSNEVLDYALQIPTYPLVNYRYNQNFNLVLKEDICCESWISLNDFRFIKCLGQGASASVFLVRHRGNGRLYALKQIQKSYFVEFKRMEQVLREKKIMAEMVNDFPFTTQLYASFQSQKHLNFLLEFYAGGQMFFHLQKQRLTEQQARIYFCQMVLTFQYLHQKKIVYRDLKPENIMIDFSGHAKLTDFGLCKINLTKTDLTTSYCGSIQYMAPEIKDNVGYNYSVDFYTLGAFLYEMVMGVPPYYNNQKLFFNEGTSSGFQELVKGLIQTEVADRIDSFKTIKSCRWLQNVKWEDIAKMKKKMPLTVKPYESYIHDEFKDVPTSQLNAIHQEKYDKLFDFFTFVKIDNHNTDFIECYPELNDKKMGYMIPKKPAMMVMNSISMKKKKTEEKSLKNRSSNSNSRSKKGASTSKSNPKNPRKSINSKNIYMKRAKEDLDFHRSISPKAQVYKKNTITLKNVKSGSQLMKGVLPSHHHH